MLLELEHASSIVGKEMLAFTNVRFKKWAQLLEPLGKIYKSSIVNLKEFHDKIIILDPKANETLSIEEAKEAILVIGGIMGNYPPKGRTYKYITSKIPSVRARNIGKHQFSIDGAIFIAKKIAEGNPLESIPFVKSIRIEIDPFHEIILPFAYPLSNGKPLIYDKLIEYLKFEIEMDEERMLQRVKQS